MAGLKEEIEELVREKTERDLMLRSVLSREGFEFTTHQTAVAALKACQVLYAIDLRIAEYIDALPKAK